MTNRRVLQMCFGAVLLTAVVMIGQNAARAKVACKQANLLYELRTYTTAPGRLPALHKRFRDHTMRLFAKHGMKNVIYWTPADRENTLVYVIAHQSKEAAEKSWAAFRDDPVWQKAYQESKQDGPIVTNVTKQYLEATDYSPMK